MSTSCTHCGTTVGPSSKIQPTTVTAADGKGPSETWCPRCFVAKRMHEEGDRFQAHQTCAIQCRRCGWESVSFGGRPGSAMRCNQCSSFAGKRLDLKELPIDPRDAKDFVEAARDLGAKVKVEHAS